jgi:hypothetical protein
MIFDGLLLAKCVLGKPTLLPLLYELKHLLSYFGLIAHDILFKPQIYTYASSITTGTWTEGYHAITCHPADVHQKKSGRLLLLFLL